LSLAASLLSVSASPQPYLPQIPPFSGAVSPHGQIREVCEAAVADVDAAMRFVHGAVAYYFLDVAAENTEKPGKS
jgi:hypothetical protein